MFKTKRFLYEILRERLSESQNCLLAVLGARKVGKTVLFKQLNEYFEDSSVYFDCTKLLVNSDFDFEKYYKECVNSGKRIIFLDEVCKLGIDYYADFISLTKEYSGYINIVITGSVSFIVEKYLNSIGRGISIRLPQFLYIERLCWNNNINEPALDSASKRTSDSYLKQYLRNQMLSDKELLSYMKGVVQDTMDSYRERTFLEDIEVLDDKTLLNALRYISLSQLVYKKSNGVFIDIPSIERELRDAIFENYKSAKVKYNLKSSDIQFVLNLLLGCGLAKKLSILTNSNIETFKLDDSTIPALLFEYPWYSNVCLSVDVQKSGSLMSQWLEYLILLRASYIYEEVDKCRINDSNEVDLVYSINNTYSGVEIKDRPYKNNHRTYINREQTFAKSLNLKDFILSSSDSINRNDKIILALELEYIRLINEDKLFLEYTISELLSKYNLG